MTVEPSTPSNNHSLPYWNCKLKRLLPEKYKEERSDDIEVMLNG